VFSRATLRLLRSLPKPVLLGAVLSGLFVVINQSYPGIDPLRQPFEVLALALTGFLIASWTRLPAWRIELLAGAIGALLVAGFYLSLTIWLTLPLQVPLGEALIRAALVGVMGAGLARLLRQRAVL
jgi:hypothetical protein